MIQSFVSYLAHVPRPVAFVRWRRRSASCENFPGDGYPAIPRNLNSLLRPISPSAQSLLPAFPGLARMAQIIRSARRAAPRHPRSYRFSGLALAEGCFAVADATISAASLHCALAPAASELFRNASRLVSCVHLLSASGNLFQTTAAVRIEFARSAPQALALPTARKAGPATAPAKTIAAPALPRRHPSPSLREIACSAGLKRANAAELRALVRSVARLLAPGVRKVSVRVTPLVLAACPHPNVPKFPGFLLPW